MKYTILLSIALFAFTSIFADETDVPKVFETKAETKILLKRNLEMPWANTQTVKMQKVYSKDAYTLWKCPAELVNNYPGVRITGKDFNYFVFKNGSFHLTVNEMNKESVYTFFTSD